MPRLLQLHFLFTDAFACGDLGVYWAWIGLRKSRQPLKMRFTIYVAYEVIVSGLPSLLHTQTHAPHTVSCFLAIMAYSGLVLMVLPCHLLGVACHLSERIAKQKVILNDRTIDNTMSGAQKKVQEFQQYKTTEKGAILSDRECGATGTTQTQSSSMRERMNRREGSITSTSR